MNAVGIDVSKGKSTVAVIQPFGVVIAAPYDVSHTDSELIELADFIKLLPGETKVVMEYTGTYYEPIANALHNAGISSAPPINFSFAVLFNCFIQYTSPIFTKVFLR